MDEEGFLQQLEVEIENFGNRYIIRNQIKEKLQIDEGLDDHVAGE